MLRANILAELAAQYMISDRPEEAIVRATSALEIAPPTPAVRRRSPRTSGAERSSHSGVSTKGWPISSSRESSPRVTPRPSCGSSSTTRTPCTCSVASRNRSRSRAKDSPSPGKPASSAAREPSSPSTRSTRCSLSGAGTRPTVINASLELEPPMVFRLYLRRAKLRSVLWRGDPEAAWLLYREWAARMSQLAAFEYQTRAGVANDLIFVALARGDQATATEFAQALGGSRPVGSPGWELPLIGAAALELARRREASAGSDSPEFADEEVHLRELLAGDAVWPTHVLDGVPRCPARRRTRHGNRCRRVGARREARRFAHRRRALAPAHPLRSGPRPARGRRPNGGRRDRACSAPRPRRSVRGSSCDWADELGRGGLTPARGLRPARRRPHRPRAAGARPRRRGTQQRSDRRAALHQPQDRERARLGDPAQARRGEPDRSGPARRAGERTQ